MGNTFITPDVVAKLALPTLLNNLMMAGLVYRDYAREFRKVGNTVRIRKPATLTAIEFDGDLTGEYQNITESYIDILLDKIIVVPVEILATDLTLDIMSFNTQIVQPAVEAIAQELDVRLCKLYKDVPYYSDTTHATTAVSDILNARKVMVDNKMPFTAQRYAVMSPLTTAALLALDAFAHLDKTGSTKVLREASLGRIFGYEFFENQNIQNHAAGAAIVGDALGTAAVAAVGDSDMVISALSTAGAINKGTIFVIESDTQKYVVTADAVAAGGTATIYFYPTLKVATTVATKVVTFKQPTVTTSRENLMFHKNAFAMVTAPIAPPIGGAKGATMNYKGLTINIVYDYVGSQFKNVITFSVLCGFKTLTPELALRLYDQA